MKKVAIVGYTPTRTLAPFKNKEFEVWGINDLYKYIDRYDRWFQMHTVADVDRTAVEAPGRDNWQTQKENLAKMACPVYMQNKELDIPNSIEFPLGEIIQHFGGCFVNADHAKYFTNSISYMIAMAIYEGVEELHIYGVDMATGGEYGPQRPSCEFWLGVAAGRGIKIHIPDQSDLLKTRFLYGYEDEKKHVFEKKIEQLKLDVAQRKQTAEQQMTQLNAQKWQFVGAETALKEVMMAWQ